MAFLFDYMFTFHRASLDRIHIIFFVGFLETVRQRPELVKLYLRIKQHITRYQKVSDKRNRGLCILQK